MENLIENNTSSDRQDPGHLVFFSMLIVAAMGGALIGVMAIMVLGLVGGVQPDQLFQIGSTVDIGQRNLLRIANGVSHLFTFTIGPLVFAYYFFQKKVRQSIDLKNTVSGFYALMAFMIMVASFPFVQLSYWLNRQLPLPESFTTMEESAQQMLDAILTMNSPMELILNLLVIGVLPAVGEEILFRGLVQKRLSKLFQSGHLAIWVAAFVFSAIHMQFEGFLPRMFLGAILGYLFYYTKNLWVPIIGHLVFNAGQVLGQYFFAEKMAELEKSESIDPNYLLGVGSMIVVVGLLFQLRNRKAGSV
ncbi:MAG: CPBP family intramembrane glutamic endopeptidase [Bacteroidota bacterium]